MSAKTKIVVLHMKEVIYTGIFAALGILLIVLLAILFLPGKEDRAEPNTAPASATSLYIPGIYTTELILGGQNVDIEVIVDAESITSIRLVNLSEAVTTMYPLLQPTFDAVCSQVYEEQSLENISYSIESKYTSLVLLQAIGKTLEKARPTATPSASPTPASPTFTTPTTLSPAPSTSPGPSPTPAVTASP